MSLRSIAVVVLSNSGEEGPRALRATLISSVTPDRAHIAHSILLNMRYAKNITPGLLRSLLSVAQDVENALPTDYRIIAIDSLTYIATRPEMKNCIYIVSEIITTFDNVFLHNPGRVRQHVSYGFSDIANVYPDQVKHISPKVNVLMEEIEAEKKSFDDYLCSSSFINPEVEMYHRNRLDMLWSKPID